MVGAATDPDKRIGMLWDTEQEFKSYPPGTTTREYEFDGVLQQQADESSILNYYKQCNLIRNAFPSIMRGVPSRIEYDEPDVLLLSKKWNDETVYIVINFAQEEQIVEYEWPCGLAASLTIDGEVQESSGALRMPGYSIAVMA